MCQKKTCEGVTIQVKALRDHILLIVLLLNDVNFFSWIFLKNDLDEQHDKKEKPKVNEYHLPRLVEIVG